MRGLLALMAFLTRIPSPYHDISEAARSFHLAPLVGALVSLPVAAAYVASQYISELMAAAAAMAAHVALTGAMHLEGLADYVDALAAGARGERALKVMKDPRVGAAAVSALLALMLIRFAALAAGVSAAELALSYVAAYEAVYVAALATRRTPPEGLGRLFVLASKERGLRANVAALAVAAAPAALLDPVVAVVGLGAALAAALATVRHAERSLGLVNGDVLGSVLELALTSAVVACAVA